jgi:hypothetical protein
MSPFTTPEQDKAMTTHTSQYMRWLASFPRRVWTQGANGKWSSREPTYHDREGRRSVAERLSGER